MNGRCPRSRFWDLGKHKPLGARAPSAAPQVLCSQFPQKAHTGKRQTCRQSPRSHGNSKGCVTPVPDRSQVHLSEICPVYTPQMPPLTPPIGKREGAHSLQQTLTYQKSMT